MRKKRILVLSFATLAICYTARPQAVAPPFSISISSPQDDWKLGSDVTIDVAIRNNTNRRLSFATCPGAGLEGVRTRIEVRDQDDTLLPSPLRSGGALVQCSGPDAVVQPGETMTYGIAIGKLVEIKRPGKYTVQVERREGKTKVPQKSNELTIRVSN